MLCAMLATAVLTSCAPQAAPTPTPTPHFTSDQQAYAAAEQTYRNYIDASNAVDISNPATFEGVYAWETGAALDSEKKSLTKMHSDGWSIGGETAPGRIEHDTFSPKATAVVTLRVCMDVSRVIVKDADGKSLVRPDRPNQQPLQIKFDPMASSPTGLLISSIAGADFTCDT